MHCFPKHGKSNDTFRDDVKALLTKHIAELTTVNEIVWELAARGILADKELWFEKLEEDKYS